MDKGMEKGLGAKVISKEYQSLLMMKILTQLFDNKSLISCMECLEELNKTIEGSDYDKVDYYLKRLKEGNLLPDAASLEEKKDDNMSEEVRKEGNLFFQSNPPKYLDALKAYNKSLCLAISKENQCLALTNRSSVFFKIEMYKECLESIQQAQEVGLLEDVREKVQMRARMCQERLKKMLPGDSFVPKIGMPVNEKIPFLAKCVELRENEQYGRHVVTSEDIPAGTVIAIKKPFCKIVNDEEKYMRCTNCFVELAHLLIPCDTCTQVMFCSKECKETAYKDFHAIECLISGSLFKTFDIPYLLAFRMTIKAFLAFPDTETLTVALEKMEREQKNFFSYDWSKELSLEDLYTPIRTLMANTDDTLSTGVYLGTCLAFNLLKHSCQIFSQRYLTSRNADILLKNLMCHHIQIVIMNCFAYGNMTIQEDDPREGIKAGICGFFSLINHSCAPNVTSIETDDGSSYGVITTKNVSKGNQLFISYRVQHTTEDRDKRRKILSMRHAFHCQCEACEKNFPMLNDLPSVPKDVPEWTFEHITLTINERFTVEFNKKGLRLAIDYIQKYSNFFPSRQLCKAEKSLIVCLKLLTEYPLSFLEKIRELDNIYLQSIYNTQD